MFATELNFKPKLSVLNDDQVEQLQLATLEVLERTGVQLTHPRALELLDGAGARVDGNRVRLPAWLVEEAIRQAPSRVVLGQRNGDRTVLLEGDKSWFGPTVDCVDYLDPFTAERRPFTRDDCRLTATLADALPNYTWVMTIGMAADSPADIADRVIARQVLTYCRKPMVFCSKDLASVRDIYDMAVLIAGSEERFRQAPTIAPLTDPISPLLQYDPTIDKLLFCAEKGIPVVHLAAPQAGSTAPATFAGTVVQGVHHNFLLWRTRDEPDGRCYGPTGSSLRVALYGHGWLLRCQVPRSSGRGRGHLLLPEFGSERSKSYS
jgi:trimethylamine--corrinoid protein Co-methyltransferase